MTCKKTLFSIFLILFLASCNSTDNHGSSIHGYILTNGYRDNTVPDSGEIYLIRNGEFETLLEDGYYPENVDIAMDGTAIAYSKGEEDASDIYVMDLETMKETRITNNSVKDQNPNLSPDNSEIIYWSSRDGNVQLYISDSDGTNERNIINNSDVFTFDPEWSHDGKMIAFNYDTTKTGCKAVIYVGILNSSHTGFDTIFPVSNTGGAFVEVDPAWSSEDELIAFSTYEGPGCWNAEGLQAENLIHWKIKTVELDIDNRKGDNLMTVWASSGTVVNWLPIWANEDQGLIVIHSVIDGSPDRPFGTSSYLSFLDLFSGKEHKIDGTDNCYFPDYLEFIYPRLPGHEKPF